MTKGLSPCRFDPVRCPVLSLGGGNEAARVHQTSGRDGDSVVPRGSRGATSDTCHRISRFPAPWSGGEPAARISPGLERGRLHRRREPKYLVPVGGRSIGSVTVVGR